MLRNRLNQKVSTVSVMIAVHALQGIGANLAHPITPAYLNSMNFPSSMFGIVFAAMSFTNFAFSPFWGIMSRYIKARTILLIGSLGYALGQGIFGFSSDPYIIIAARLISGAFVSAQFVGTGLYVVKKSHAEDKSKNITKMVTIFSVFGTMGYFLGGYIGDTSLKIPFIIQVITLASVGILYYILLEDNEVENKIDVKRVIQSSSPIVKTDRPLKPSLILNFWIVFLISTASTSLTQTFSYFIDDALKLPSSANGITKGLVGILSLALNFTIAMRIVKSKDIERNIMRLFIFITALFVPMVLFKSSAIGFMSVGVVAMSFDTMPVSLIQGRTVEYSDDDIQGEMVGYHNTMKSLGMILGSLVAGWIYAFNIISPFIMSLALYVVSTVLILTLRKYVK